MNNEVVRALTNATKNVLETMAQTSPQASEAKVTDGSHGHGEVTGIISMSGMNSTGSLTISFDEKSILAIVSRMLMEEFPSINSDVVDAVGELTNMICGGAKRELSECGYVIEMAKPLVVTGKNVGLTQMKDTRILTIPFTIPEGTFIIETSLFLDENSR